MSGRFGNLRQVRNHIGTDGKGHLQATFFPAHSEKYSGTLPIKARSSWELHLMRKLDTDPSIISWGSESVVVPYVDPTRGNTTHKYFVDFNAVIKKPDGSTHTLYIEVKPSAQCHAPKKTKRTDESKYLAKAETFVRNSAKWEYARKAAKNAGATFIILTEKELFGKK